MAAKSIMLFALAAQSVLAVTEMLPLKYEQAGAHYKATVYSWQETTFASNVIAIPRRLGKTTQRVRIARRLEDEGYICCITLRD